MWPHSITNQTVLVSAALGDQGLGRRFVATERKRAMLDWEESRPDLLRVGALIALAFGGFVAFAVR